VSFLGTDDGPRPFAQMLGVDLRLDVREPGLHQVVVSVTGDSRGLRIPLVIDAPD
jgi:hypothetical protein